MRHPFWALRGPGSAMRPRLILAGQFPARTELEIRCPRTCILRWLCELSALELEVLSRRLCPLLHLREPLDSPSCLADLLPGPVGDSCLSRPGSPQTAGGRRRDIALLPAACTVTHSTKICDIYGLVATQPWPANPRQHSGWMFRLNGPTLINSADLRRPEANLEMFHASSD